jgi:hypothetical protein
MQLAAGTKTSRQFMSYHREPQFGTCHSNIKMTERCETGAATYRAHQRAQRGNFGKSLNHSARTPRTLADECSRIVRARIFECFWLSVSC